MLVAKNYQNLSVLVVTYACQKLARFYRDTVYTS